MNVASFERAEWIDPWNDRRPMTDDWVLVTLFSEGHKFVTETKYDTEYREWFVDPDDSVLGWMPLPEPMGGYMPYGIKAQFNEEWTRQ